ncbi:hypothetical protein BMETH_1578_0 [methanotrophic bacterial endosymbiont of Bathymodiolus sp.]|nr:hypothetical protein BMETH_1578_0 [methanotrophic bacterial endosymbiont of Bathymodiolus sp.]
MVFALIVIALSRFTDASYKLIQLVKALYTVIKHRYAVIQWFFTMPLAV